MTGPFKATRAGIEVRLALAERELLAHLIGEVEELLDDGLAEDDDELARLVGISGPDLAAIAEGGEPGPGPQPPEDPALARLLPDAAEDPETAAEFRRLSEHGLRLRKREGLRTAAGALAGPGTVVLDAGQAQALLRAFTDVRLVLAERLGLRTDEDAVTLHEEIVRRSRAGAEPTDDPWLVHAQIYDVLTWWQETLVSAIVKRR